MIEAETNAIPMLRGILEYNNHLDIWANRYKIVRMSVQGIKIKKWPELNRPLLILGFDGWGNALNISRGTAAYLTQRLKAHLFARLDGDTFYRYDQARPTVKIKNGVLQQFRPPEGVFFAARFDGGGHDLIILEADEPNLRWFQFTEELFALCEKLNVETIVTLGSMYDSVLPTDRIVSATATDRALLDQLHSRSVKLINYHGPGSIHSIIQAQAARKSFQCLSLWCHCPYYLQGVTHFGFVSHLIGLLGCLGNIVIDTDDLDVKWNELNQQIKELIEQDPELQDTIDELRKVKVRGSLANIKASSDKDAKVIHLDDFLNR